MHSYRGFGIVAFIAMCAACSAGGQTDGESTGETESAVDPPPTMDGHSIPFPGHKEGTNTISDWAGTAAELVLADALTACTTLDAAGTTRGTWVVDASLRNVRAKMNATLAKYNPRPASWLALRQDGAKNFRPISGFATSVSFSTRYPAEYNSSTFRSIGQFDTAQSALEVAAVNLCVARAVHEQTQLGWNFLIPSADQRYLFETVRERAQLAMLQLSDIAVALQSDDLTDTTLAPSVQGFRWFAKNGLGPTNKTAADVVKVWAMDLADSARLHMTATEKLSELLQRSAGGREERPDGTGVPTHDDFRPASWRQRTLALLYGGNPLEGASAKPGAPPIVRAEANPTTLAWPTAIEIPQAPPGSWTPGAIRFLQVAQQHDSLALLLKGQTYGGPADITATETAADWLYRDVEVKVRNKECIDFPGRKTPCKVWTVADQPIAGRPPYSTGTTPNLGVLGAWSAWNSYQLQPEDARALVAALAAILPSASDGSGFHVLGGTNLVSLPGRATQSLHFDPAVRLVPRTLLETQSIYGRMGRHRVPGILRDSTYLDAIYTGQADGSRTKADGSGDGAVLDGNRLMGSIPALAAVRDALQTVTAGAGLGGQPFRAQAVSINSALKAAIGESQFSLKPVETVVNSHVVQATTAGTGGATNRTWRLRITAPSTDVFWKDQIGNYKLSAVLGSPQTLAAVADKSPRVGFTSMATLLAGANVVNAPGLSKDASGAIVTTMSLPEDSTPVFIVSRRAPSSLEYRALGGTTKPWPIKVTGTDGTVVRLPADARYIVGDGDLTKIAVRVSSVDPFDPGMPYYDGFGEPRSRVPSRAGLMDQEAPRLTEFVSKALANGRSKSTDAYDRFLDPLLRRIGTNESQVINVAEVRKRENQNIKASLESLCGPNPAGGVPDCSLDFVEVDSMGPTAGEMSALGCTNTSGAPTTRPTVDWPAPPGVDCANLPAGELGNHVACSLASKRGAFSFRVEVARPVACAAWQRAPQFGQVGTLPKLLSDQHKAYWTFRDSVTTLELAGKALVAGAQAGDAERTHGKTQLTNQQARTELARQQDLETMRRTSQAVADAQQEMNEAAAELSSVADIDIQDIMNAISAAQSGAQTGMMIGSVFGPIGSAIGALVGGALGAIGSLFSGDRQEEILRAQNRLNEATRKYSELQTQEQELARYYGVCRSHEPPPPGQKEKWGECPPDGKIDTVMELYKSEDLEAEQALAVTMAKTFASVTDSKTQFSERIALVWSNASDLGSSSVVVRNAIQTAKLDVERARLEQELVMDRARGEFGITQFFYRNDVYETADMLEGARRELRDARRVLEFAYGVNFSTMAPINTTEAPPSAWIDQIYDYDLTPLRGGSGPGTGLSPMKIEIYGSRIEDLRTSFENRYGIDIAIQQGYVEARIAGPSATRNANVWLGNTDAGVDGGPGSGDAGHIQVEVPDPEGNNWTVECEQGATCAPNGGLCPMPAAKIAPDGGTVPPPAFSAICAPKKPISAKLRFWLDRWGNPVGTRPLQAQMSQFNGRWSQVGINLYSRDGLRNCTGSSDPNCTVNTSYVGYTLRHLGPYITTSADGRAAHVPYFPALVSGGRAFDNLSLVDPGRPGTEGVWSAFQKQLFAVPLGGLYELTLNPENGNRTPVDLELIRHVQILSKDAIFFNPRTSTLQAHP